MSIYDFSVTTIDGVKTNLDLYKGKVLLIVNVASQCGFTGQYGDLEALHKKYSQKGLAILGFPCNQFGGQEPGDEAEIKGFCQLNYGVDFPMFSKIDVNGPKTDPLFAFLKSQQAGLLGTEGIKWNFTKFLVNRQGEVVKRYAPQISPSSLDADILALL